MMVRPQQLSKKCHHKEAPEEHLTRGRRTPEAFATSCWGVEQGIEQKFSKEDYDIGFEHREE